MPYPNYPVDSGSHTRKIAWGDVYWYHFGTPVSNQFTIGGARPCVVLSNVTTLVEGTVVVCPITGKEHERPGYSYHVPLLQSECSALEKDSLVEVDQVFCIHKEDLIDEHYIATLPKPLMKRIYFQLANAMNFLAALK